MYLSHLLFLRYYLFPLPCLEILDYDTAIEVKFLSSIFKDQELERWACVRGIFNFLIATTCSDLLEGTQ